MNRAAFATTPYSATAPGAHAFTVGRTADSTMGLVCLTETPTANASEGGTERRGRASTEYPNFISYRFQIWI